MTDDEADGSLATTFGRVRVFPIKSLDGVDVDAATLAPGGGLAPDREFALLDADGDYVNGKNERRIHRVSAEFDLEARTVSLDAPHDADAPRPAAFDLDDPDDREGIASWVGEFLGYDVRLVGERAGGYPDDTELAGPTVISRGTLREVASWFDGVSVDSMRRRLRANVELAGEEAFAEDRLVADPGERVRFRVGDADLLGVNPCQRCAVPSRDPDTGEEYEGFRTRFIARREETMPDWSGGGRFDHAFRLMVNTVVPDTSVGESLGVGDEVRIVGTESE
ncbi:MOSC N-terminal beta barrel domain-containing protein [Halobaculum sp. CBA1158]|uniref:MOSC domain-containing protein n=1 Tax=Halobaculum sp. CBA1158 TaxID=2904243 RepID=UPI001F447035|nr:MOSC N-terminal beta barrel domain-containing protein [Halobaculum sp. CBA1158]UIO98797.1 MOSC N-terminal beta barrel domain-containing protein [Halobaculum sp. CBA1158]